MFPPGTKENPLTVEEVNEKARTLMTPVLGTEKTERLIRSIQDLENLRDIRELRPLIAT
jgi:2-methylcitrate dehydratase PrpD